MKNNIEKKLKKENGVILITKTFEKVGWNNQCRIFYKSMTGKDENGLIWKEVKCNTMRKNSKTGKANAGKKIY